MAKEKRILAKKRPTNTNTNTTQTVMLNYDIALPQKTKDKHIRNNQRRKKKDNERELTHTCIKLGAQIINIYLRALNSVSEGKCQRLEVALHENPTPPIEKKAVLSPQPNKFLIQSPCLCLWSKSSLENPRTHYTAFLKHQKWPIWPPPPIHRN